MNIRPIRNDTDLADALREIERIFQAEPGTPDADKLRSSPSSSRPMRGSTTPLRRPTRSR